MGRCVAHFAVDDARWLLHTPDGQDSWFLPFNQGWNSGAGNPPNPNGLKTDYLWKQVLTKESLANIIENFAQVVEEETKRARRSASRCSRASISSRTCGNCCVAAARRRGQRYLIQHSAGSGKSNTIAWLAHQLVS